jgi:hypothetical protein
VAEQAKD